MLHEIVPKDAEIGVLVDTNYIDLGGQIQVVEQTARSLGRAARIVHAGADNELDALSPSCRSCASGELW